MSSSDVGQREQEKSRLEKQYQESDRRLDGLIQGLTKAVPSRNVKYMLLFFVPVTCKIFIISSFGFGVLLKRWQKQ